MFSIGIYHVGCSIWSSFFRSFIRKRAFVVILFIVFSFDANRAWEIQFIALVAGEKVLNGVTNISD
jgi:hypothetical protein